jgi:hypothetical protein
MLADFSILITIITIMVYASLFAIENRKDT